ncbi:MAG TPA: response regulator [Myxococcales bacterium]|jgi:DNA-binding NtrC family response regulator|nr:response regulator [Myxococcales bacterium]
MRDGIVLVVDDEAAVRAALKRVLEQHGWSVLCVATAEEGLLLLRRLPVQVILSDQNMPGLSGIDLLKLVQVRHPAVVRILMTADRDPEVPVRSINESEVYRFIRKPWDDADLCTVVSLAFAVARQEQEKRDLLALRRNPGSPRTDPAGVESELVRLAEDEIEGT